MSRNTDWVQVSNIVFNPSFIKILMWFLLFGYYILVHNKEIQMFSWIGLGQTAEYSNSLCYKKAFFKEIDPQTNLEANPCKDWMSSLIL